MNNSLEFLVSFIKITSNVINFLILARVLMSWLSVGRPIQMNKITIMIYDATEPIFKLFRKIPLRIGMIDLTPLVAMIAIDFIANILISVILSI